MTINVSYDIYTKQREKLPQIFDCHLRITLTISIIFKKSTCRIPAHPRKIVSTGQLAPIDIFALLMYSTRDGIYLVSFYLLSFHFFFFSKTYPSLVIENHPKVYKGISYTRLGNSSGGGQNPLVRLVSKEGDPFRSSQRNFTTQI